MKPPVFPSPGALYEKGYLESLIRILSTYFTRWSAETEYNANRSVPAVVLQDTQMGDEQRTFVAESGGLTFYLPDATTDRAGLSWTVSLGAATSAVVVLTQDNVFGFTTAGSVTITGTGSSLTFRAVDNRKWGIV